MQQDLEDDSKGPRGSISSLLSVFPDDNADTFAAFQLISYCNFSSLILSSIVMISFYVLSKRFFLKRKRLSDARVASITKKNILIKNANFL